MSTDKQRLPQRLPSWWDPVTHLNPAQRICFRASLASGRLHCSRSLEQGLHRVSGTPVSRSRMACRGCYPCWLNYRCNCGDRFGDSSATGYCSVSIRALIPSCQEDMLEKDLPGCRRFHSWRYYTIRPESLSGSSVLPVLEGSIATEHHSVSKQSSAVPSPSAHSGTVGLVPSSCFPRKCEVSALTQDALLADASLLGMDMRATAPLLSLVSSPQYFRLRRPSSWNAPEPFPYSGKHGRNSGNGSGA